MKLQDFIISGVVLDEDVIIIRDIQSGQCLAHGQWFEDGVLEYYEEKIVRSYSENDYQGPAPRRRHIMYIRRRKTKCTHPVDVIGIPGRNIMYIRRKTK